MSGDADSRTLEGCVYLVTTVQQLQGIEDVEIDCLLGLERALVSLDGDAEAVLGLHGEVAGTSRRGCRYLFSQDSAS